MNVIFPLLTIISAAALIVIEPDGFFSAATLGAENAVSLTITLIAVYSVWLGIFEIAERTHITVKISKALSRPIAFIFGKTDEKAAGYIAANVSANLLGLGGLATPMGIKAVEELDKTNNAFAITMLLVTASTSLQILPTSVVSLRSSLGSLSPSSIVLPSIISTAVSSFSGILLTKVFIKR